MGQLLLGAAVQTGTAFLQAGVSQAVSNLFSEDVVGDRLTDLSVQTSTEGRFIPIVYGRMRLTGQVIWTGPVIETAEKRSAGGGKGAPSITEYSYAISFAVALCEGPIQGIGQIWANGELLDHDYAVMRVHKGDADQAPDPLMEAVDGDVPAYRGLAYVVFEDFPLDRFGQRIPNLSFEVLSGAQSANDPQLEQLVQGVCLIPASGEFAYASEPVFQILGEGWERAENVHTTRAPTDLDAALDDLQARLPNVHSVALVTAWFGDDLRCGECQIRPGVENRTKQTRPLNWSVAGLGRGEAHLVSRRDDAPAYGGTPSDETIIQVIKALKARGYKVTLYPFILMDIPPASNRPDPYGGDEQAVYPWRGRITCHPAPGQAGSPDQSAAARTQVEAFFGSAAAHDFEVRGGGARYSGPEDWGFSRFILHHAALAQAAGGVDSFLIGSEMRGLTTVRESRTHYPAVEHLTRLASEARVLLGSTTDISYAADWSEYFGHAPQDGTGDRLFHLDPLWSSPEINFIGIDWYGPLSDWREGSVHADSEAGSIYNRDYLLSNVTGGEGGEWYYASSSDRANQVRTPVTDGAYGEAWIWAYKALPDWWSNTHHNRVDGVRETVPTDWRPRSKPIRLVELGCPAVDKGANQPNVFLDPKSAESAAPYFSTGRRDDLIQRRYIETLLDYWRPDSDNNPHSSLYNGPMLDAAHSHVWTWDARPFPEFPARTDIWRDGDNWRRGHWLSGRAGQSALGQLVFDLAQRAGLEDLDVSALDGVVTGFIVDRPRRVRDLIQSLGMIFGFRVVDRAQGAACITLSSTASGQALCEADLVADEAGVQFSRPAPEERPAQARLTVIADDGDYAPASITSRLASSDTDGVLSLTAPLLTDREQAKGWAQNVLDQALQSGHSARLQLPPSQDGLEAGDVVLLDCGPLQSWRLDSLDGAEIRRTQLGGVIDPALPLTGSEPGQVDSPKNRSRPLLRLLDLPLDSDDGLERGGFWAVGWSDPWPGGVDLFAGAAPELVERRAHIAAPAFTGVLLQDLGPGPEGRWDHANTLHLKLYAGQLSGVSDREVLDGANKMAVETDAGWEVLSYAKMALQPDGSWRLSGLLRGLAGSPHKGASSGARVVVLDEAGAILPVRPQEWGVPLTVEAALKGVRRSDPSTLKTEAVYTARELRPLSPVHVRVTPNSEGVRISWIRRGRVNADAWNGLDIPLDETREAYRVDILSSAGAVLARYEVSEPYLQIDRDVFTVEPGMKARICQLSDRYGAGAAAIRAF